MKKISLGSEGTEECKRDSSSSSSSRADAVTSDVDAKIVELKGKDCGENNVTSSGESIASISRAKQVDQATVVFEQVVGNDNVHEELDDLRGKVVRLMDQNEAWQTQNDSLQLEIENMHMQNENLKNIIEIGKSTVETAKKISQDLAEENKTMKQREKQNSTDLQKFEFDLKHLKSENQSLVGKHNEMQVKFDLQTIDFSKLQENFNLKNAEVQHLYTELSSDRKSIDKNNKFVVEIKSLTSLKDDLKSKLIKCRENCRNCLVGDTHVVKISDFGMSREEEEYIVSDGLKQIPIKWTAPEALNYGKYTSLCDVWSFGVLAWEIFSKGGTPYQGMTNTRARELIDSGYRMPAPEGTPDEVYQLMLRCWQYEPEDRPHFAEIHATVDLLYSRTRDTSVSHHVAYFGLK